MKTDDAYNNWAAQYDTNENKTRDLEKVVAREVLSNLKFTNVLELGCGTGKNTEWLAQRATLVTAVDFSEQMLDQARKKIGAERVSFVQADILRDWDFGDTFDLVTCSLILEHVRDLGAVFAKARNVLHSGAFYICELHPFKQYLGSKARFESERGLIKLETFTHHVSEYFQEAQKNGFVCRDLQEWFDPDEIKLPRLISFVFGTQD